jgi:thiamine-monophosphate kinase
MPSPFLNQSTPRVAANAPVVSDWGETLIIERIRKWLGKVTPPSPAGIGDDCALLIPPDGKGILLTTDSLNYGHHFNDSVAARQAGSKLVKRNISDIAAMGGKPGPALLNLLMGQDLSCTWLAEFISGIEESCLSFGVEIVGGDISQLGNGQFSANMSLCGFIAGAPKLRTGASIRDSIYVTGTLGGSIRGKHFDFEPRLREGQWLAEKDCCTAMMDLTDGLGKDLRAILPPDSSASIRPSAIPVSDAATKLSAGDVQAARKRAFCDGEDYELLFTVSAHQTVQHFENEWHRTFPQLHLTRIGSIIPRHCAGAYIDGETNQSLPWTQGFEHLKKV